ncbi:MAG: T9SS type A sorting domain-containing protein [Bacteroidetes bacterium]|nr:T9SS type A sorting domain-containing protein [Bacteroidota bacterium]
MLNLRISSCLLLVLCLPVICLGQSRIDGSFAFQSDPNKKYSIYIPSSYNAATPNKLMLGLHPFNTTRWNGVSWCDTLIDFAEANDLLLICPDGGIDGKIDDPIDTAFTTAILDSMELWYNIDSAKIYVMGFSWGGKTVYTYGLARPGRFGGYMPIGAAINNTTEVNSTLQKNSSGKAVYIVHGLNDSPNTRFWPVFNALDNEGALIDYILMSGVGHTIDFPNRNQILTDAFIWIDSVNCNPATSIQEEHILALNIYPNPAINSIVLEFNASRGQETSLSLKDTEGKVILALKMHFIGTSQKLEIDVSDLAPGVYIIELESGNSTQTKKIYKL